MQEPAGRDQLHVALSLESSMAQGGLTPVSDCRVDMVGHLWPVELKSRNVVHEALAAVPC